MNGNNGNASYGGIYFNISGVENIPKEMTKFIGNKNFITNIYRIQTYDSMICEYYFCIGFTDFMLTGKSLLDYTNLLSPKQI